MPCFGNSLIQDHISGIEMLIMRYHYSLLRSTELSHLFEYVGSL